MRIVHAKSVTIADATGTATGWFGATTVTVPATDLQRPSDWNSAHNLGLTLAGGNTTQNSTWSGTNLSYSAAGNLTLGLSGNTLLFSARNPIMSSWGPHWDKLWAAGAAGAGTLMLHPLYIPNVSFDRLCLPILFTVTSNSTNTMTLSMSIAFFTLNGSTLSLVSSTSTSYTQSFSGTSNNSSFAGMRLMTIPWSSSFSEANYIIGIHSNTTAGGGGGTISNFFITGIGSTFSGILGAGSNATNQMQLGLGLYSASFTSGMPNSIALSHVQGTNSFFRRPIPIMFTNGTV